jgi:hypothetical protein
MKINWIVLVVLNIFGSAVLPIAINWHSPNALSNFESFQLAGITFIIVTGVELLDLAKDILAIRTEEHRTWAAQDQFDSLLTSIRSDYRNMGLHAENEDPGFVREMVRQRVERLRDDVHLAAENKEIYVDNNHAIDTTRVTNLFRENKANCFFEVFKITDGGEVFDVYGGAYFKQIFELVSSGHIKEVKALIVVDTSDASAKEKTSNLITFYESQSCYDARVISLDDFKRLHQDAGLEGFEDFGIYGTLLIFRTASYEPEPRGRYSYDSLKIKKHREFFYSCWNQPARPTLPTVDETLTLDDVLKL